MAEVEAWLDKMMTYYNGASRPERQRLLHEGSPLFTSTSEMQRALRERAAQVRMHTILQCLAFAYLNSGIEMPSLMLQRLSLPLSASASGGVQQQGRTKKRSKKTQNAPTTTKKKRQATTEHADDDHNDDDEEEHREADEGSNPRPHGVVPLLASWVQREAQVIARARAAVPAVGLLNRVRDDVLAEMRGTTPEGNSIAAWRFLDAVEAGAQAMRARRVQRLTLRRDLVEEAKTYREDLELKRVKMLKENDWEGYMNMLRHWKSERITTLIEQTDSCLANVLSGIHKRRRDGDPIAGLTPERVREELKNLVHVKKEAVTQPLALVGGVLKPYQLTGLEWLVSLYNNGVNGILADEMGLGKTISTIALFTHLIECKQVQGPFLVVVPLATLPNWRREFEKWAPSLDVAIWDALAGPEGRVEIYNEKIKKRKVHVVVTTYSLTRENRGKKKSLLSRVKWSYIVVDEGHRLKNDKSKLARALSKYKCTYRLILTGTPFHNNLGELFALLSFLLPDVFDSATTFEKYFGSPFDDDVEMTEEEKLLVVQSLHKALEPFLLRRLKKDVAAELPPLLERTVICSLSAFQERLDAAIESDGRVPLPGGETKSIAQPKMSLKKLCTHPLLLYYDRDGRLANGMQNQFQGESLIKASGKFALLDSILYRLRAAKHKVLIFDPWTRTLDLLEEMMMLRSYPFLRMDGATPSSERDSIINSFTTDPNAFVFLLSTKAAGEGVNLQVASTVIIFEEAWNPQNDLQAKARAHRFGQENIVLVLRMVTAHRSELSKASRVSSKRKMEKIVIQSAQFDNTEQTALEKRDSVLHALRDGAEYASLLASNVPFMPGALEIDNLVARSNEELDFYSSLKPRNAPAPLITRYELPEWAAWPGEEPRHNINAPSLDSSANMLTESIGGFAFPPSSMESLGVPMDTCPICQKKEEIEHGWVQCDGCGRWWHRKCCEIRPDADLQNTLWKCPDPSYCMEMPEEQHLLYEDDAPDMFLADDFGLNTDFDMGSPGPDLGADFDFNDMGNLELFGGEIDNLFG